MIAGAVNSVAGGGSLIAFPSLVAFGETEIIANATNTAGLDRLTQQCCGLPKRHVCRSKFALHTVSSKLDRRSPWCLRTCYHSAGDIYAGRPVPRSLRYGTLRI